MPSSHRGRRGDSGETLLEGVIALSILAVSIVGVLGAFGSSSSLSARHRTATSADAVLYQYAERIKAGTYVGGATAGTVNQGGYTAVAGFTASVEAVRCWSGSGPSNNVSSGTDFPACTVANDKGLQAVTVRVSSADNQAVVRTTIFKRKP